MTILVIGEENNLKECQAKFGGSDHYQFVSNHTDAKEYFTSDVVVFDFIIEAHRQAIEVYSSHSIPVFLNSSMTTLAELRDKSVGQAVFFGFCGIPSFLNREILEVVVRSEDHQRLKSVCDSLKTQFAIVEDNVGLVTPRIICMIINEAYFVVQENVASRSDIDLAMKLGTNYPFGPFEWCDKIGIKNVSNMLKAVYESAGDERYKICKLLEEEAKNFV